MVQLGLGNSSMYDVIIAQAWRPAFGSSETTYNPGILVSAYYPSTQEADCKVPGAHWPTGELQDQ